jgi:uncharacterized membrane protein HdeD (DUF308 family)
MKIFHSSIFRALCAIVVGALLLKFPQDGVTWLTMAVGELFLISGIIALIAYWYARKHSGDYVVTDQKGRIISGGQPTFPIVGAGSVLLGLILVVAPDRFVDGLMYVLGGIMILGGIQQLINLVVARRLGRIPFVYWICPSLVLITGMVVILYPMQTAEMPLIILGWCSLVYGVTELVNSLKIWRVRKQAEKGAVPRNDDDTSVAEEISSTLGTDD